MPYTKTIWAEDTPITTALLNKIENGIESATKDALPLTGGTLTGNLVFSNLGIGGGLNANIQNAALHGRTGNGQMLTVDDTNRIYVGNPDTPLVLESSVNPEVNVGGRICQLYHTGNKPTLGELGALAANGPSFQGNMVQTGEGGQKWIYHINASAGSLHIAPQLADGTNDWDRQITFDRNGQIFCNGRKKVPTWDGNPSHYMFRYGSGLGGANGYITFSY